MLKYYKQAREEIIPFGESKYKEAAPLGFFLLLLLQKFSRSRNLWKMDKKTKKEKVRLWKSVATSSIMDDEERKITAKTQKELRDKVNFVLLLVLICCFDLHLTNPWNNTYF